MKHLPQADRHTRDLVATLKYHREKVNMIIIVLLACIVVILLFNATGNRRQKIQYVVIPQQQQGFPPFPQMFAGNPYQLPPPTPSQ